MKKFLLIFGLISFHVYNAQVSVIPKSKEINELYKGGDEKFVSDVQNNFNAFSSDFQANGKFLLTFNLDEKGKIKDSQVSPNIDNDFSFALIRAFKRVKNNFEHTAVSTKMAVLIDFNPTFKNDDGRERFTEPTMTERFKRP